MFSSNRINQLSRLFVEFAPTAWILLFALFVARAWLELGHFPHPSRPDPKNLGMDFHHGFLWLSLYLLPWMILAYGSLITRTSLWAWLVLGSVLLLPVILLVLLGPHAVIWPTLRMIPWVSALVACALLLIKNGSFRGWVYMGSLLIFNAWLFLDPLRLMEWFYD